MADTEWLKSLKVGDKAVVSNRFGRGIQTVERATATQIVMSGGAKFRRRDGGKIGGGPYSAARISPATDEVAEEIKRQRRAFSLAARLSDVSWRSLPLETLEAIVAMLPEKES